MSPPTVSSREFDNAHEWLSDELMKTQRRLDQGIQLHPHEERQYKLMHCILVLYRMCEEIDDMDYDAPHNSA